MLTKIKLIINNITHDLSNCCVKNWEDISCSFKRSGMSGIVRSFTSQFEFVDEAYDLLLNLFNEQGFKAKATFELYTINDRWEYNRAFVCDLDFSTINWNDTVLKINAIDNSIAAKIKANQSTKYEFVVGEDIPTTYPYYFDRLEVKESATYAITDGESSEGGFLNGEYNPNNNYRIYVGQTGKEIGVGGYMITKEDQEYGDGYMISAIKHNTITVDYKIDIDRRVGCASLWLMDGETEIKELSKNYNPAFCVQFTYNGIKVFNSIEQVESIIKNDEVLNHSWAVDTDLWRKRFVNVENIAWEVRIDANGNNEWSNTEILVDEYVKGSASGTFSMDVYYGSKVWLKFNSNVKSKYCILSSEIKFTWNARGYSTRIDAISPISVVKAIVAKMCACGVIISDYDKRLNNTLLLAAESIRDISNARIYSSFNDFCGWMETVFGYTYIIDEDSGLLQFVHRNEIFSNDAPIKEIDNAIELEYSVDNGTLYSNVVVGYDKQDYESVNGRDEFNFNNCYTTGYTVTEKKIELKSKYRADSYGIEFLVQKRSVNTTDSESDDDIFFVLGSFQQDSYKTVRDCIIDNTNSNTLINGEFCPMNCIYANAEYIGMMANSLQLTFTSSEGNSNVVINGNAISGSIYLEDLEMLSSGILKFQTDDVNIPTNLNSIIKVNTHKFIYTGYIKDIEVKYSRQTSVEYTLIVKSKELCS